MTYKEDKKMWTLEAHMFRKGKAFYHNNSAPLPNFRGKDSEKAFWAGFNAAEEQEDPDYIKQQNEFPAEC